MSDLKRPQLRAHLEDLGYLVFVGGPTCFYVARTNATNVAYYDTKPDATFRHGWVELPNSAGRIDCSDWLELVAELQENHRT